jgi:hypothetical protein
MEIKFYISYEPFGWMSNFARYPVMVDGLEWPTSEHYYQAQKTTDFVLQEEIRQTPRPGDSKRMGMKLPIRPDWEQIKDDVMRKVVKAKFEQHPDLKEMLLGTGDAILIEHTENDQYWGDGGNGSGKNMLGKVLMEVRELLKC